MKRCLLIIGFSFLAGPASASMLELYGFQPRAASMAGAHTSVADDFTAVFYNPAGLALNRRVVTGAGYLVALPSLGVQLANPVEGVATPVEPQAMHGVTVGALFPLGAALDDRIAIGVGSISPQAISRAARCSTRGRPNFTVIRTRRRRSPSWWGPR